MAEIPQNKKSGYVSLILAAFLVVIILILFFQNSADINVKLITNNVSMPLSLLILICIFLGIMLGAILIMPGRWRLYRANRRLKKEIKSLTIKPKELDLLSKS